VSFVSLDEKYDPEKHCRALKMSVMSPEPFDPVPTVTVIWSQSAQEALLPTVEVPYSSLKKIGNDDCSASLNRQI
jgi:hypothetical protein